MRVLFIVSDGLWNASARAFVLAARGLAARGIEVEIACAAECPVQVRAKAANVPVTNLANMGSTLELRRKLEGVDIVFVHSESELVSAGSALVLGRGKGRVIRREMPFRKTQLGAGARLVSRFATTEVVTPPLGVDTAEHDAVTPIAKTAIGVPAKGRLIVCLFDGQKKNVLTPLRTLALLAPRHPDLHMAVIGAERPDEFRMHGAALGINSMVTFLGARNDELAIMRAADIGWIAADGDAAAFAALDFAGCRIPVVAERNPLTEHYVADGVAGLLLPPADPAITAASVAAFLARDDARASMGNAARARLEREFSFAAMIDGFEHAIRGAAAKGSERTVA
jgi:glycosyltransferase involved in cell wall biosynthesis